MAGRGKKQRRPHKKLAKRQRVVYHPFCQSELPRRSVTAPYKKNSP